jgi:hypothetical protein
VAFFAYIFEKGGALDVFSDNGIQQYSTIHTVNNTESKRVNMVVGLLESDDL